MAKVIAQNGMVVMTTERIDGLYCAQYAMEKNCMHINEDKQ